MSETAVVILVITGSVTFLCLLITILFFVLRRQILVQREKAVSDVENLLDDTEDNITRIADSRLRDIRNDIGERMKIDAEENRRNRMEISGMIREAQKDQAESIKEFEDRTGQTLKEGLRELRETGEKKLDEIQNGIRKKLDTDLNERLDTSFKAVGEQLNKLYVSLGELGKLENGVSSLNRTLSNVKTRGIFGETQLENILANILPANVYEKNVVTKKSKSANRDAVEFAVKIPDKETAGEFMYLPVDSKFPGDILDRIQSAAAENDPEELKKSAKELETRIRMEAKDIQEKYLDPPNTTDFAIMFLPVESLYAEVLRIPGLVEDLQKKNHIVVTGPTTLAALLNSLSIGFRYMAVNRDSQEILKLLSAIKSQYTALSGLIETADRRIEMAGKATKELQHRTEIINRRLSAVEELDPVEAQSLLGIRTEYEKEQTE